MIAPEHEDLIQRALDGRVTPDEAARLRAVLVRDREASELDARLQLVRHLLDEAPRPEPPPAFDAAIMRAVTDAHSRLPAWRRVRRLGRALWLTRTDVVVSTPRKIVWATAAAGALAVLIAIFADVPPVDRATEGTAGVAGVSPTDERPAADDPGVDPAVARLLAGDALAQTMRDESATRLLADRGVRAALANSELRAALAGGGLSNALASADSQAIFQHPLLQQALIDPSVRTALDRRDVRQWLSSALQNRMFINVLQDPGFAPMLRTPEFLALVEDANRLGR